MPTIYPSLAIGAKARLAIFRKEAQSYTNLTVKSWRDVRFATLKSHTGLSQGLNANDPIWATQDGAQFRNERDCHDVLHSRNGHTGWYSDVHQDDTVIGIIARLPHGRIIAGYRWTCNDERVYYPETYVDEEDAARMSDEHARVYAESCVADSERFEAEQEAEQAKDSERITIVIETNSAAFENAPASEIATVLRAMADRIEEAGIPPVPRDSNGNVCGSVTVESL